MYDKHTTDALRTSAHPMLIFSKALPMSKDNLFQNIPNDLLEEKFEEILKSPHVRIERILSLGHTSPLDGWYDQTENEWVMVVQGKGRLEFDDGATVELSPGDHINIPAHKKHRVVWTDPNEVTIWLAVFY